LLLKRLSRPQHLLLHLQFLILNLNLSLNPSLRLHLWKRRRLVNGASAVFGEVRRRRRRRNRSLLPHLQPQQNLKQNRWRIQLW